MIFHQNRGRIADRTQYLFTDLLATDSRIATAGDRSTKFIGYGGQDDWNGFIHGRKCCGIVGVRMHDAMYIRPVTINPQMGGCI